ncbi:helix-turn-helix domain-containing protein [Streptomyces mirabilis]|uniref:helix-turn-helix domain-containing protein n=1 Tax=Streptomyces mirabilis TaxID=68239 RepID=UPI00365E5C7A
MRSDGRRTTGGVPETSRSGRYLSLLERQRIAALRSRGLTIRQIAGLLGRAPSTVSRELRRNSRPHDYRVYDAALAHHRCSAARSLPLPGRPHARSGSSPGSGPSRPGRS